MPQHLTLTARLAVLSLLAVTLITSIPVPPASGQDAAEVIRYAGESRTATAAAIATSTQPTGPQFADGTVIVARADDFPDGLAASGLAGILDAPVLLTHSDTLDPHTRAALEATGAPQTIVLGGETAVSPAVVTELSSMGETVRLAGTSRFDTAAQIAAFVAANAETDTVLIASGDNWPDALVAGAVAAGEGIPLLLTSRDTLPSATADALDQLAPDQVVVIGGPAAISPAVLDDINGTVTRLSGPDRFATAVEVANWAIDTFGWSTDTLHVASGEAFPDALGLGPAAGLASAGPSPILLAGRDTLPAATAAFLANLDDCAGRLLVIAGGTAAISDDVAGTLADTSPPCRDTAAPQIQITSPTSGAVVSTDTGEVTITGTATDDVALSAITLSAMDPTDANGQPVELPVSFDGTAGEWTFAGFVGRETLQITATATDTSGNHGTDSVTFTVPAPTGTDPIVNPDLVEIPDGNLDTRTGLIDTDMSLAPATVVTVTGGDIPVDRVVLAAAPGGGYLTRPATLGEVFHRLVALNDPDDVAALHTPDQSRATTDQTQTASADGQAATGSSGISHDGTAPTDRGGNYAQAPILEDELARGQLASPVGDIDYAYGCSRYREQDPLSDNEIGQGITLRADECVVEYDLNPLQRGPGSVAGVGLSNQLLLDNVGIDFAVIIGHVDDDAWDRFSDVLGSPFAGGQTGIPLVDVVTGAAVHYYQFGFSADVTVRQSFQIEGNVGFKIDPYGLIPQHSATTQNLGNRGLHVGFIPTASFEVTLDYNEDDLGILGFEFTDRVELREVYARCFRQCEDHDVTDPLELTDIDNWEIIALEDNDGGPYEFTQDRFDLTVKGAIGFGIALGTGRLISLEGAMGLRLATPKLQGDPDDVIGGLYLIGEGNYVVHPSVIRRGLPDINFGRFNLPPYRIWPRPGFTFPEPVGIHPAAEALYGFPIGCVPAYVTVTPDGSRAAATLTADSCEEEVRDGRLLQMIDLDADRVIASVHIGTSPTTLNANNTLISPDGAFVAHAHNGAVHVWDVANGELVPIPLGPVWNLPLSGNAGLNGEFLVLDSVEGDARVHVFSFADIAVGHLEPRRSHSTICSGLGLSHETCRGVLVNADVTRLIHPAGVADLTTGEILASYEPILGVMTLSTAGDRSAAIVEDGTLSTFDPLTRQVAGQVNTSVQNAEYLVGRGALEHVFAGSQGRGLVALDTATGEDDVIVQADLIVLPTVAATGRTVFFALAEGGFRETGGIFAFHTEDFRYPG